MNKLLIYDIDQLIEKEHFSTNTKKVIEILLSAINDWPNTICHLDEYELEVQKFIMNTTTSKNIENVINKINLTKHAWQAESLSELLAIYNYFKDGTSLKEIICHIRQQI